MAPIQFAIASSVPTMQLAWWKTAKFGANAFFTGSSAVLAALTALVGYSVRASDALVSSGTPDICCLRPPAE